MKGRITRKSVKRLWLDGCRVNDLQPRPTFASIDGRSQKPPCAKRAFSAGFDHRGNGGELCVIFFLRDLGVRSVFSVCSVFTELLRSRARRRSRHREAQRGDACARPCWQDEETEGGEEAVRLPQAGITQSLGWNSGSDGPLMVTALTFVRDRLLILPDRKGAGESVFATRWTRGGVGFFRFFDWYASAIEEHGRKSRRCVWGPSVQLSTWVSARDHTEAEGGEEAVRGPLRCCVLALRRAWRARIPVVCSTTGVRNGRRGASRSRCALPPESL